MDVITLIRVLLLLISCFGYVHALSGRIRPEFVPGVTCAGIGSIMVLAGLCGMLPVGAVCVFAGGLILFLLALFRKENMRRSNCFANVLLLLLCGYFLWNLYGLRLTGYDDFSHWGVIARILVNRDRFPDTTDLNLSFQSYPPGSAAIIYYFVKIGGIRAEWAWLFVQAAVTLSFFIAFYVLAKTRIQQVFLLLVMLVLLCSNTFFINLLVDTLIMTSALCAACFCLYYRERLPEKLWWLMPQFAFLLTVKNSGIFFVLMLAVWILARSGRTGAWKKMILMLTLSAVPLLLWRWHVRMTFPQGMVSKHAFSLEYFRQTLTDKNLPGVKYILVQFLRQLFSLKTETVYLLLFAGILALFCRSELREKSSLLREVLVLILVSGMGYLMALFLMYLISMPWFEASILAGFDRYLRTFTTLACALLSVGMLSLSDDGSWSVQKKAIAGILWIVVLVFALRIRPDFYLRWPMEKEPRTAFDALVEEYEIPPGQTYLVVTNDDTVDPGYLSYMIRYVLDSPDVVICRAETLTEETREECEWVIAYDWDDTVREAFREKLGKEKRILSEPEGMAG